jgi:transposase-like protein
MQKKYSRHNDKFKLKVAIAALKGDKTTTELCQEFGLAASQIYAWKKRLEECEDIFTKKNKVIDHDAEVERLLTTIGKLKVENDFLEKALGR